MWVARNKQGNISVHNVKPFYCGDNGANEKDWWGTVESVRSLWGYLKEDIPWLTFENSPQEIILMTARKTEYNDDNDPYEYRDAYLGRDYTTDDIEDVEKFYMEDGGWKHFCNFIEPNSLRMCFRRLKSF